MKLAIVSASLLLLNVGIVEGKFRFERSLRHAPEKVKLNRNLENMICYTYMLDFNDLTPGDYITDELKGDYGVTIFAENTQTNKHVYTPNNAVRVFDTANPGTNNDNGDPDLGAPNRACPDGGPGVGDGGGPNAKHPNCEPLGNVIIIQESNKVYPDDSQNGGDITFTFDYPVVLKTLGLLDIEEKDLAELTAYYGAGGKKTWDAEPSGDNGYFKYPILDQEDVTSFKVHLPGSGALSHVEYAMCRPELDVRSSSLNIPIPGDNDECPPEDL